MLKIIIEFKIAICDDEDYFRQDLQEMVSAYMAEQGYVFQIDTFCSGEEFMSLGMEMMNYTVVFLDICMDEIDGVTVAKEIRKISRETYIVFVTAYVDYALEGYKLDVVRYLLKDNSIQKESEVFPCLFQIEKSLKEQGFFVKRADREDIKCILAVYYEQNVTTEKLEDFDGERWVILGEAY